MPAKNDKNKAKEVEPKKALKDLPVRKADADKVKGGAGNMGSEQLR